MTDIWGFLIQTLTASGAAALLLAVKAMFRDKLSPRWQFGIWGVLALVLLLPAGWGGRYALVNWPMWVEALKSALTGQFGTLTRVTAPVPLPRPGPPQTAEDWLHLIYAAGAAALLARYLISYARLRRALNRGRSAQTGRVRAVAERYGLPACPAVEVDGLSTAFVCGVFRPVLALPAGVETDEKVILHELLHLNYKDVLWGWLIALLRCIHWCNPLLWLCAGRAGNDLEALCDQRVLERLEGEERRDYGRILLSMADEQYAQTPGTSSAANGGRNIARRIQAIARFKRYPAGMELVSVCVALVLAAPLAAGVRAETVPGWTARIPVAAMASARTVRCTTCAGAFDAYAKSVLAGDLAYRAMCAPLAEQNRLAAEYLRSPGGWKDNPDGGQYEFLGLEELPDTWEGYRIYNLTPVEEGAWEGLLALWLHGAPEGRDWDGALYSRWLAIQRLRAEREGDRWVVHTLEDIRVVPGDQRIGGNLSLPATVYEGRYGDFTIRVQIQTTACVDSKGVLSRGRSGFGYISGNYAYGYDLVPRPGAVFDQANWEHLVYAEYTGGAEEKGRYARIGVSVSPVYDGAVPELKQPGLGGQGAGVSSSGGSWGTRDLDPGWDSWIFLAGGGSGMSWGADKGCQFPDAYAASLYLNDEAAAELTLLPVEGGEWIEP